MARIILMLVVLCSTQAFAAAGKIDAYDEVEERIVGAYTATLAEYAERVAANPGDVMLEIRRCAIADAFAYATDYYVASAADEASACYDDLVRRYPGLLAVEIARLAVLDSEVAAADALRLHDSGLADWNNAQHAKLHEFLAGQYGDDKEQARHCLSALRLDRGANCRVMAARHFMTEGQPDKAISILNSPLDPHTDTYYRLQKLALLSELGATDAVREQYELIDFTVIGDYQYLELATQLASVGLKWEALAALNKVSTDYWNPDHFARAKFDVALASGDYAAALLNYNLMRDLGIHMDPFLRARITLAARDSGLAWQARDFLALFPILAVLLTIALLTWLIPALVHYRGLARRARAYAPGLLSGQWRLRHAWYVLFSIVFSSIVTLFIFEYELLVTEFNPWSDEFGDWSQVDSVRLLIVDSLLAAVLVLPVLVGRERLRYFRGRDWSVARCIGIAFAAAILLRIAYLVPVWLWNHYVATGQTLSTEKVIGDMYLQHGALATYLLVALLTPLAEEFMFRGVLLQGFAQHLSFRWANLLQAAIFASLHENLQALPLLFAFGVVAGIMTRKAGGLFPAIALHAFFNITAIIAITWGYTPA